MKKHIRIVETEGVYTIQHRVLFLWHTLTTSKMVDGTLQVVNREFTSIGDALEYVDLHFNSNSTETIICFVLNGKK